MPEWLSTPELPGYPAKRITLGEYRRRVKAMPYVWKPWRGSAALYRRDDGAFIAAVKREEAYDFIAGLVFRGADGDVTLRATNDVEVEVPTEDVVAFTIAFMKVAFR